MNSKTSLEALTETLTAHEYNDVVGPVTINAVEGMLALATAMNRLADVGERLIAGQEEHRAKFEQYRAQLETMMMALDGLQHGGHA